MTDGVIAQFPVSAAMPGYSVVTPPTDMWPQLASNPPPCAATASRCVPGHGYSPTSSRPLAAPAAAPPHRRSTLASSTTQPRQTGWCKPSPCAPRPPTPTPSTRSCRRWARRSAGGTAKVGPRRPHRGATAAAGATRRTRALNRDQIATLSQLDVGLRDKTYWRLLYEIAARAEEILALNVEDLDLPTKRARVVSKGGSIE
jgi:hypothetical protein